MLFPLTELMRMVLAVIKRTQPETKSRERGVKGCDATDKKGEKVKQQQAVKPQINKFLGRLGGREARVDAIRFAKGIYLSKSLRMRKVANETRQK